MKTIKFRAWDGEKMWYDVQDAYDNFGVHTIDKNDDPDDTYKSSIDFTSFENVIESAKAIMQFTGLLDKNRNEIYENDIVRFEDDNFLVEWAQNFQTGFEPFTGENDCHGCFAKVLADNCEVIGNIYENSNLLFK